MTVNETDLFDERKSLRRICDHARMRMVAPFPTLLNVILRLNTSTSAHVMLPPIVGSPKPPNMVVVNVGPSGYGKTAVDDTAEEYLPVEIPTFPLGTAEGLCQAFDPDEDGQPGVPNILFSSSEIDNWAALGERAGSMMFPVLRQVITGDQIGQKNASKAYTRVVNKRSYRIGISLSAQPGSHGAAVLFRDSPGGFPQRCLFASVIDPDAPDVPPTGVTPYVPDAVPDFTPNAGEYYEIPFPASVVDEIREHRRKVLRGDAGVDPLDGHRNLTKEKVAVGLMILEGRNEVTEDDWRIAERIMAISDATRASLVSAVEQASRNANRARALASVDRDEVVETTKLQRTKHTLIKHLSRQKEMPRHDLRKRLRSDQRQYFDAAITELIDNGQVFATDTENSTTYRIAADAGPVSTWTESPRQKPQVTSGGQLVHGGPSDNVTDLDSRRSNEPDRPKLSCQRWFDNRIAELVAQGHTTASSFAVYAEGQAAGYTRQQLRTAASTHPDVTVIDRTGGKATWDITGATEVPYRSALEWVNRYLDKLTPGTEIDKDRFRQAGIAAGHSWTATRRGATESGRIESVRGDGLETVWVVKPDRVTEDAS
ncbi:MAG: hypothetical protein WCZ29_12905 [Mycolicibacterium vanbaalenii]|uniref:hypothetical protein n=1 Tax=Mycolicibacterium vanbaalenii TaxID=110539 RepID=UPI0035632AE0